MKLDAKAFGLASGLLWGGCVLTVGLANLIRAGYGVHFL